MSIPESSTLFHPSVCPRCGTAMVGDASVPLCPRCLLLEGLEAGLRGKALGDYELLEEIARGGMGVVYKARQKSLDRVVAVKLILWGTYSPLEMIERFRREAETVGRLQHPNIVRIHDVGTQDGQPFFSMDYVDGTDLEAFTRHQPIEANRAARYLRTIALAIDYAHQQGVIHRDLKPSNVLIDAFDEPRITDFGLARGTEREPSTTLSGQVLGSPSFMPPEQAAGEVGQVSERSDIYSLGALLHYLLTGRALFSSANLAETLEQVRTREPVSPRRLNPAVPRDLATICLKCLEKKPPRRYPSASALADELERFLAGKPIRAHPVSLVGRGWRWCRRNRALATLALGMVVSALVALAAIHYARRERVLPWTPYERVRLYLEQGRFEEAAAECQAVMKGSDPDGRPGQGSYQIIDDFADPSREWTLCNADSVPFAIRHDDGALHIECVARKRQFWQRGVLAPFPLAHQDQYKQSDFVMSIDILSWDDKAEGMVVQFVGGAGPWPACSPQLPHGYIGGLAFNRGRSDDIRIWSTRTDQRIQQEIRMEPTHPYRLVFARWGSRLTLAVTDLEQSIRVKELTLTDSTKTPGWPSLFVIADPSSGFRITVDNFFLCAARPGNDTEARQRP